MDILKIIINKYYSYSDNMLAGFGGIFLIVIIIDLFLCKKRRRNIFNRICLAFFNTMVISCTGELMYLLGLTPKIEHIDFNALIFVMITGVILVYGIFQVIIFRKVIIPVLQVCKFIKYTVFFEVFLLSITKHLELKEWITGTLAILCIELMVELLCELHKNRNTTIAKESDYPNGDLYYTRQRQLEKFIPVLEQQKSEPYAIMISGEWGMGKSSFMMALEKKVSKDAFIWVQVGSEKSVPEIMLEISEQIQDVLVESNILIERRGLIEKYFLAFAEVLEETKLSSFNKIVGVFKKEPEDTKKYLNSKLGELKKLNKTIYLVIDDLDRCDKEYQLKMFKVIRESTQLVQCKTIFLVDKNEFLNGDYELNQIEKYVNYTLELCTVNYKEIVGYLLDDLFDDGFVCSISSVIIKSRSLNEIKSMIYGFPSEMLKKCEEEICEVKNDTNVKSEYDKERDKEKIKDIEKMIFYIKKNTTNSRKVKNFLKGIKRDIGKLNDGIDECSREYQKEDWLKAIVVVNFTKNILPDIYDSILRSDDLIDFQRNYESYSLQILFDWNPYFNFNEKKKIIFNSLIYNIDVIDFAPIKVEREKYLSELHGDKASIKQINEYIKYAEDYNDFSRILSICMEQKFEGYAERENFIKMILNALSRQTSFLRFNNQKFLDLSRDLIKFLKLLQLSEKEKNICVNEGLRIIRRVISDNVNLLRDILFVLFGVDEVWTNWQTLAVTDINELYLMLKRIDNNSIYKELEDETDKLLWIKKYYENLITDLQSEEYKKSGLDLDETSTELNNVFEICKLWLSIESLLNGGSGGNMPLFDQYFWLDGMYSPKDVVFLNISNLEKALEVLGEFYNSKTEDYESRFSLILLRVSFKIVLQYENAPKWFEGKEREVRDLLKGIANKVYLLDDLQDDDAKETIRQTKIFLYRFDSYCNAKYQAERIENYEVNN